MYNKIISMNPNYMISSCGIVTNIKTGKVLKADINRGYKRVRLGKYGKKYSIHRLVAEAFIENIENKPQVNHIDGDKSNNNAENLEWCTHSENLIHAVRTGLKPRTTKRHQEALQKCLIGRPATKKQINNMRNIGESFYKITIDIASEVCEAYSTGMFTQREIAKELNISLSRVNQIINNKWSMNNV